MKLKTDLKRIKRLANHLGKLMDEKNAKICSDCKLAYIDNKVILTVKEAREVDRIESKEAGCCSKCEDFYWRVNVGTATRGKQLRKQLRKLKRLYGYDDYYHFFDTEKKCCKLPRHKRSSTCLSWGLGCLFGQDYDKIERIQKIVRTIESIKYKHGILH